MYRNSLLLAGCTAVFGSLLTFTGAYLLEKTRQSPLTQVLRLLSFVPMAVPGLVLGLGYVFSSTCRAIRCTACTAA